MATGSADGAFVELGFDPQCLCVGVVLLMVTGGTYSTAIEKHLIHPHHILNMAMLLDC